MFITILHCVERVGFFQASYILGYTEKYLKSFSDLVGWNLWSKDGRLSGLDSAFTTELTSWLVQFFSLELLVGFE